MGGSRWQFLRAWSCGSRAQVIWQAKQPFALDEYPMKRFRRVHQRICEMYLNGIERS